MENSYTNPGFEKAKVHSHRVAFIFQQEEEMVGGFGDDTLFFLEGDNSFVVIGTKISIVGTSESELEFRLLRILGESCGKVTVFPKISLITTNSADDDAIERNGSINITTVNRKDMFFASGPFPCSEKDIGRRILR